jgi:hypothetical protein
VGSAGRPGGRLPSRSRILAAVKLMRVLLFDVFGTLVDWRSSLIELAETAAAAAGGQLELLDCRPQDAGMVAAHPSDLAAAAALGLRPIFARRPLEWGPGVPPADPPGLAGLLAADGLGDLAEALGC